MKRFLSKFTFAFILMIILATSLFAINAFADSVAIGDVEWNYEFSEDGSAITITGAIIKKEKVVDFAIPSHLLIVNEKGAAVKFPVTTINENAFTDSAKKIYGKLTIPDTITSIGEKAFDGTHISGELIIPNSVTSIGASAFSNIEEEITSITLPIALESIPENAFTKSNITGSLTIPSSIKTIGKNAFSSTNISGNLIIPHNVTTVGESAFENCTKLTSLTVYSEPIALDAETANKSLEIGNNAFANCTSISSLRLGTGVTSIGTKAFANTEAITEITFNAISVKDLTNTSLAFFKAGEASKSISLKIGKAVTKIPNSLFQSDSITNSPRLTSISFDNNSVCESIGVNAFANSYFLASVTIPNSVKSIQESAFKSCYSLSSFTIGAGLETIGKDAFLDCFKLVEIYNLSQIEIIPQPEKPEETGYIGKYALDVYTSLDDASKLIYTDDGFLMYDGDVCYLLSYIGNDSSLLFPKDCNGKSYAIYDYAFYNYPTQISITFSDGITAISKSAFENTTVVGELIIPDSVIDIYESAFANIKGKITKLSLSNSLTEIKAKAFYNSYIVANFVFPEGLTSIGDEAFSKTIIHGDFIIPEGVSSIGASAFSDCFGINSIKLPTTITELKSNTFNGCLSLQNVNLENITLFGSNCFYNCQALLSINLDAADVTIQSKAFSNCQSLHGTIDLKNVISIASDTFQGCKRINSYVIPTANEFSFNLVNDALNLDAIYTTANNTTYFTIDGVLFKVNEQTECSVLDFESEDVKYITINNELYVLADGILYTPNKTDGNVTIDQSIETETTNEFVLFNDVPYILVENVLHRINKATLVFYPYSKEDSIYKVPDFVDVIGERAFQKASNVERIIIGDTVTSIMPSAFSNSSIESAFIPDSITTLNAGMFANCSSLKWVVLGKNIETAANCFTGTTAKVYARSQKLNKPTEVLPTNFIPAKTVCTNHLYGFVDLAPTCERSGYNKCTFCDAIEYKKMLEHSGPIIAWSELSCTTDAYALVDCEICKKEARTDIIEHKGHRSNYTSIAATDTTPGYVYATCVVCYETYISSYTPHITTDTPCTTHDTDTILIPTTYSCKTNSLEIVYCKTCGENISVNIPTEKTPCNFVFELRIESSCSVNGQIKEKCSICENVRITQLDLAPHTHSWYTVSGNKGYEYSTCSVCGTFEINEVDYSVYDTLLSQVSKYYDTYYAPDTVALLTPIWENRDLNLTQDAVDYNVELLRNILSNVTYNVTDVPVVFIEYDGKFDDSGRIPKTYSDAKIYVAYMDENGVRQTEIVDYTAEIKGRGNSTYNGTKCPYNIKFSNKVDLFGMGAGKKYCLMANLYDQTLIRNAIVIDFAKSIGLDYTPNYEFVEVYLNGEYDGVYMLTTPMDVDENRIEIDEEKDFLLEIENKNSPGEGESYIRIENKLPSTYMNLLVESPEDIGAESYSDLVSALYQINIAIFSGDWELIQQWVDVESMAKYYLVHEYLKEVDMCYDSTRLYIEDGKLHGGPVWDFDLGMGNVGDGGGDGNSHTAYNNGTPNYVEKNGGAELGVIQGNYTTENGEKPLSNWASTTGYWARGLWESNNNKNGVFDELYIYSDEFIDLVAQYIDEYSVQMQLLYENYYSEEEGKSYVNAIDALHKDQDFTAARIRNWKVYKITGHYTGMSKIEISYEKAISYLREWLERRHEWLNYAYLEVDARPNN